MAENPGIRNLKPGNKRGPSKTTKILKDAILEAANAAMGKGGKVGMVAYLTLQAEEEPVAFMGLLGKVLPMQIAGDPENPLAITIIERRIVEAGH